MITYRPATQSQFWVQASPFSHFFTSFSGIKDTAATSQYADGIRGRIYQLRGPKTLSEATVSSPFDPERHADIVDFWKSYNCEFITVTVTPVTCGEDPGPRGQRAIVIPDAQLTSLAFGQVDRTAGTPATIELTFVMDNFTYS